MILPVRCYTCGKVLANLTNQWIQHKEQYNDDNWKLFFDKYKIQRYCCKRVIMSQVSDPNHDKIYQLPSSITISNDKIGNMFIAR